MALPLTLGGSKMIVRLIGYRPPFPLRNGLSLYSTSERGGGIRSGGAAGRHVTDMLAISQLSAAGLAQTPRSCPRRDLTLKAGLSGGSHAGNHAGTALAFRLLID